ncbi:MAG: hypothetical protein PHI42_06160 [Paludibacteraceae bacterium]|nr:hypothetical protein [Paludibacteraceae bacterium]
MTKFYKGQSIYRFGTDPSQKSTWASSLLNFGNNNPKYKVGVLEKDLEIDDAQIKIVEIIYGDFTKVEVKGYYVNDTDFVYISEAEKIRASLPKSQSDSTTQTPSKSRRNITIAIIVIVVIVIVGYFFKRNR